MPLLTYDVLSEQNATTTNAIITTLSDFVALSEYEGEGILARDHEDASKLQAGIDIAKEKGVLDPNFVPEEYIDRRRPGEESRGRGDEILGIVREGGSGARGAGGRGSYCADYRGQAERPATLQEKRRTRSRCVCWSNGNVFRSVTLPRGYLVRIMDDCDGFDPGAGTDEREFVLPFMSMLEFGKFNGKMGLASTPLASEVQKTALKAPRYRKTSPRVAEVTLGEVVLFASDAIKKMGEDGIFAWLEGREQDRELRPNSAAVHVDVVGYGPDRKITSGAASHGGALGEVKEGASEDDSCEGILTTACQNGCGRFRRL
ncbi:LOW QUALITY PROTEIN: hypothetical protein ACHAW5_009577 [Stephanodiscus triporus]|uniref:Uncharacterized protein n=1 Tax=Stephanodiscus triporus TaxID=2934178 RepID=A0ABD3NFC0_9STRA